jgi:tetratricopeptide (TPR) repeat protein
VRSFVSIILLSFIILVPPSQCTESQPVKEFPATGQAIKHIEQGDEYFDVGSYDDAITEYTAAIKLDTEMATAYWGRGRAYHFGKGIFWRAVDDYSKSIDLNPNFAKAYFYRGLAYTASDTYDKAISDFTRTVELEPNLSMAYNLRAWCYVHKALWDESSQSLFGKLIESDPRLAEVYKGKGWTDVRQPQWEFFVFPDAVKATEPQIAQDKIDISIPSNAAAILAAGRDKSITRPHVKVTPLSGPVGTKLFIYGWGFRINEDGMTVTWDGEIIKCNIRTEVDGSLIIDGSKVPYNSSVFTGDTRETVYVPPTTRGRHILGVYGSSFTPIGIVNDTVFEVSPSIKLVSEPDIKGTKLTITGTGFAASETIAVTMNKATTNVTAITDSTGSFTAILIIPASKIKEYYIDVSGNKGTTAQASLMIVPERPLPVEQVSNLAEVYCNRGYAHFRKAQWAFVIADLDKKYMKDPALNRSSWNKDWAVGKQKQWDMVIADYDKVIATANRAALSQSKSSTGLLKEELELALANYREAALVSTNPAFGQRMRDIIKSIEGWER